MTTSHNSHQRYLRQDRLHVCVQKKIQLIILVYNTGGTLFEHFRM